MNMLRNMPITQYTKLNNGLTVTTEERDCWNVSFGIVIDAGARYESFFENGIGHFFEHIAFKGTRARNKCELEMQMSATGARFKCFTTREMVGYYVECLSADVPLCLDILADCVYNNSYTASDIEHQKKVVYMEMHDQDRDVNELLDNYLHQTAFQGTPLAQTVMGPSSNLYNYSAHTIERYQHNFYGPTRTVVASVGGVKHDFMVDLVGKYFGNLVSGHCVPSNVYRYCGSEVRYRNDSLPVAAVAMAVEAPSFCDEDCLVMELAANVIGGWDRTQTGGLDHGYPLARASSISRIADAYRGFHITYKDAGLWGIKFTSTKMHLEDMVLAAQHEWMGLCQTVTETDLERARQAMKLRLLSEQESATYSCLELARWTLYVGYRPALADRLCAIDDLHTKDVRDACYRYVYDKCPAVAAIGPTENLSDYTRLRAGMYWLRL